MDHDAIARYIHETFDGLDIVTADGNTFYFYDPGANIPPDRRLPFATLVTSDQYDQFSNLDRPSVYRLNFGVGKKTFDALFGAEGGDERAYDFSALDQIMPHPVYGQMFWLCVLSPSAATFQAVRPLLAEAYERAASRHAKSRPGDAP